MYDQETNKSPSLSVAVHTVKPTSTCFLLFSSRSVSAHTCTTEENPQDVHLQNGVDLLFCNSVAERQRQLHLSSPLLLWLFLSLSTPTIHFLQFLSANESAHTFLKEIYLRYACSHIPTLSGEKKVTKAVTGHKYMN